MCLLRMCLFIAITLLPLHTWAQSVPKVDFAELVFHSAFEKAQFEALRDGKPDALALLIAADSNATTATLTEINNSMAAFVVSVPVAKLAKKGDDKVIKYIFDTGHTAHLKRYQLDNYFTNIFSEGRYNCVSASAFYYYALQQLGIAAQIHETPNHIYVVAYPQTLKILLETTDPLLGFQPLSSKYAKEYISIMQAVKLVSEEEMAGYGTDEAFEQLFFADKEVSLLGLAGIQYLNSGLYHYEAKNYRKAYQEFKKAMYIYPDSRSQAMLVVSVALILDDEGYTTDNITLLGEFIRYGEAKDPAEVMVGEFSAAAYSIKSKSGNLALIDTMYYKLAAVLTDSAAKAGLDFIYHYNKAAEYQDKGAYNQSQTHLLQAYNIRPYDVDVQTGIAYNLSMKHFGRADFEALATDMEQDLATYAFLKENYLFTGQLCMVYLGCAGTNFEKGNPTKGNEYLKRFEATYHKEMKIDEDYISMCYGSASGYYFKQGYNSKAKAMVKKGLEYVPGSYELQRRLKVLE